MGVIIILWLCLRNCWFFSDLFSRLKEPPFSFLLSNLYHSNLVKYTFVNKNGIYLSFSLYGISSEFRNLLNVLNFLWKCRYIYVHNGIILSHKKQWNNAICTNIDGPRDDRIKWSKSERETNTVWYHLYVESKIWHKGVYLWKRSGLTHREQIYGCQRSNCLTELTSSQV